jgi:hypothetical protein
MAARPIRVQPDSGILEYTGSKKKNTTPTASEETTLNNMFLYFAYRIGS